MSELKSFYSYPTQTSAKFLSQLWLKLFCERKLLSRKLLDQTNDFLLVTENLTLAASVALAAELKKPLTLIVCAEPNEVGRIAQKFPAVNLILIPKREPHSVIEQVVREQQKGRIPCLLRIGLNDRFLEEVVRKSRSTTVPCYVMDYVEPCLTLRHAPLNCLGLPSQQAIGFGFPIAPADFNGAHFRQSFNELGADLAEAHPAFQNHLARACVSGLKSRQWPTIMTDSFQAGRALSGGMLLAVAWELSLWLKKTYAHPRIGIVLPPGLGAALINLACILANKTPVNLNFTLGRAANESALRTANIKVVITAELFVKKLEDFPWPEERVDLPTLLKSFPKKNLLWRRALVFLLGSSQLADLMQIPEQGGEAEVGLLFTSGSSGDPKGVTLSHKNILSNVAQIDAILPKHLVTSIMGCLPIFHSFGFTATLWWPLVSGPPVVTYVSPLEVGKIADAIEKYAITLLISTPTFLRSYLRKVAPQQLHSLNLAVTGAEKLPPILREEFETKFQVPVCEGYGMTETTPVIGVNVPARGMQPLCGEPLIGKKDGSIGQLCPGIAVKVTQPSTDEELPSDQTGLLWFKGPNIFSGYLNDPDKTALVLVDGWYMSGDVGFLDEDGFLHIEGRLSRFSKVAGEMVPHGNIEHHLFELAKTTTTEDVMVVVMGITDTQKGEALVALTTHALDREIVRKGFSERGLPNLWIPKHFFVVEQIPLLASGKLDLKGCQKLVNELSGETN